LTNQDAWTNVCPVRDIPKGEGRNFMINGLNVVIFHSNKGFFCRSGLCKHNNVKLELGRISGDVVTCPFHNWQYQISTGKGVSPDWTQLDCYPLEIRSDDIWVQAGKPHNAMDDAIDTSRYNW